MPSKKRPARKPAAKKRAPARRRRVHRKPTVSLPGFLWLLAVANLGAGLAFSPATGLRQVGVVGAKNQAQVQEISRRLAPWSSVPWARHSESGLSTALLADNRLAKVDVKTNIFGRGRVVLTQRVPVAMIEPDVVAGATKVPDSAIYLDSAGILYRDVFLAEFSGPRLIVPAESRRPQLSIIQTWPLRSVALASVKGQGLLQESGFKVVFDERSVISLHVVDGPLIILGPESDLDEKFAVLDRAFRTEKDKILGSKLVNVSAPDRPVFSP